MAQLLDAIKFIPGLPISKDIPVQLSCSFYFEIPKSLSKKKRAALDARHVKKPDADNLLKFVADCGVGILWHDDAQVSVCNIEKVYSEKPRTEISVRWQD